MQMPKMETLEGAVLIADIAGFTKLTETLGSRDVAGVELLTKCINSFFGKVIDMVLHYGGDVMRFAGDSIICCFNAIGDEKELPDLGLEKATLRSLQCAASLIRELGSQMSSPLSHLALQSYASSALSHLVSQCLVLCIQPRGDCINRHWNSGEGSLQWLPTFERSFFSKSCTNPALDPAGSVRMGYNGLITAIPPAERRSPHSDAGTVIHESNSHGFDNTLDSLVSRSNVSRSSAASPLTADKGRPRASSELEGSRLLLKR